jgi:MoaA/NifB/PqqE/SkfB family radical SAM enzyme
MIKLCKDRKIEWIGITTNGMLLNTTRADQIINAGLDELRVSLDSSDENILRELRPPTDLDTVLENLRYFSNKFNGRLSLNAMINKENLDTLSGVVDFAKELDVKYIEMVDTKTLNEEFAVSEVCFNGIDRDDKHKVVNEIRTKCRENGIDCFISTDYFTQCFDPFHRAYVDVNGNLTPCCTIPDISVGNILERGLNNVWNGNAMRQWRRRLLCSDPLKRCLEVCRIKSNVDRIPVKKQSCAVTTV